MKYIKQITKLINVKGKWNFSDKQGFPADFSNFADIISGQSSAYSVQTPSWLALWTRGFLAWSTIPISSTFLVHGKSNIKKRKNIKKGTNSSKKTFFQVSSPRLSWLASITFFFKPSKTLGKPSHVLKLTRWRPPARVRIASSFTSLLCTFQDSSKSYSVLEILTYW